MHLARDGAAQAFDLRRGRGGDLPGDGDRAADDARLGRGRIAFFPRRRRALELHDVLQREPVECRAIALPLEEIEEREPGEHRKLGVVVVLDAFLELLAGIGHLPIGEAKRRVLEHRAQSGIGPATSNEACAGAHCARLAPVTVMSPPAGSRCGRPLTPACAASSRADAARGRASPWSVRDPSSPVVS